MSIFSQALRAGVCIGEAGMVSIRKEGGTSYSLRRGIRLHWGTEF
jgi:hypothetical protein